MPRRLPCRCPLVRESLRRFAQLLVCSLGVSSGCVQVLMAEDLSQRNKIVLIIGKELVSHRVPQQMRMNLEPANGAVLIAQVPNATIREWSSLTDEHVF